jgi:hypothetical protein
MEKKRVTATPTARATTGRAKSAQKMSDSKREALRLAVYVRELGAEPVALQGKDYRGWERGLQRQYQELRESLGKEAGQSARVRGRAVIRREGLSSAVADLLPTPMRSQRRNADNSKPVADQSLPQTAAASASVKDPVNLVQRAIAPNPRVCQRKYRHSNFLTAMLHARELRSPGLHVYPCDVCGGLHVGHDPESEHTQRARAVTKRLRAINQQLAAMERQAAELRRERQRLLSEQGINQEQSMLDRVRQWLLGVEGWLATFEQT